MVSLRKAVALFLCLFLILPLFSQEKNLPSGYSDIQLGLSVDEVKAKLKKNTIFGFRGNRDVSLLPTEERVLIETPGSSFFSRCWFQFYEDKLYAITLNVNRKRMDYYSMFTKFCNDYGEPDFLNNEKAEWKNDSVMMSLEKPLTVKYIDINVYDSLIEKGKELESTDAYLREKFLETF